MRPTYSPSKPMPKSATPIRKKTKANRVNKPSASEPTQMRRTRSTKNSSPEAREMSMPTMEKSCRGTTENPVIKSKFSRIRLYIEYFERPAKRSSWAMGTSMGFMAYKDASAGMKVLTSRV